MHGRPVRNGVSSGANFSMPASLTACSTARTAGIANIAYVMEKIYNK